MLSLLYHGKVVWTFGLRLLKFTIVWRHVVANEPATLVLVQVLLLESFFTHFTYKIIRPVARFIDPFIKHECFQLKVCKRPSS